MELRLTEDAKEDIRFFKRRGQSNILKKIEKLLNSVAETPFSGIGKPEPLKYQHSGRWSRRIDQEHRMVYEIINDTIFIYSLRGHY